MANRDYITVQELNYYISRIFIAEELLHNVPVLGEVSGCSVVNGNCYFTLKDDSSQIKINLFKCEGKYVPHNGEQVIVRGYVDYYQKGGTVSVNAYEIKPFGIGAIYAKLEETKQKLEREGLFSESHKKNIPQTPKNIGIITSVKGAALQDILTTFSKHNSKQSLSIIDVRVQGEYCVGDIVTALTYSDAYGFDVIILARGGGSFEDLYCFNDESIVRAIYDMKTPIITAIGHETDYTLCDFVSDYRAITPTAAAEKVAINYNDLKDNVYYLIDCIAKKINNNLSKKQSEIYLIANNIKDKSNNLIKEQYGTIQNCLNLMKVQINNTFERNLSKCNNYLSLLESKNPLLLLKMGYFRILYNNKSINSLDILNEGNEFNVIGSYEKITATVIKKEKL